MPDVEVTGPDGQEYSFPDGTDKSAAIKYFKAKGIGAARSAASPITAPMVGKPASPSMQKVQLFTGQPQTDLGQDLVQDAKGAARGIYSVSAPGIASGLLEKHYPEQVEKVSNALHVPQGLRYIDPMKESVPNAVATIGGEAGIEGAEPSPTPPRGRTVPPPPREAPLDPEAQAKYTAAIDKTNKAHGEALAEHAIKEADARAKWVDKAAGAKRSEAAAEAATNKRATLERGSKEYTRLTHENLQQTHAAARGSLDQRWGQFRQGTEGIALDPSEAFNSIEAAKAKYLKGSPSSLTLFNNLAKEMGIQEFMEGDGGELKAIPGTGQLPFDTARVHYSAIGDKLSQGNLPGNVYQALKAVSDGLDQQLTKAADTRGLGREYSALKSSEHQFRSDWKDSRSPLAKAYQAQDPNFLAGHVTGKGSDLMMKQLARYREFGAKPYLPAAARRLESEAEAVTRPRVSATPGKYQPPRAPELKPVERPKPTPPKAGKVARAIGRVTGKVVGGAVGSKLGHPLVGYGIGGELGTDAAERLARRGRVPPPPE